MSQIKIDRDIPLPPAARAGKWEAIRTMEVGDSCLVPSGQELLGRQAAYDTATRTGKKFVTRTTDEGLRVWRTA